MAIPRILVVSDNGSVSTAVSTTLRSLGYHMFVADNEVGGLDLYKDNYYAIVVVDLNKTSGAGLEFVERLRQRKANATFVLVAERQSVLDQDTASRNGIRRIVERPIDVDELIDAIEDVLCGDSMTFDQKHPESVHPEANKGQMVRGDRPAWCEVCGYNTHWRHKTLMRHFCSDACLKQFQGEPS